MMTLIALAISVAYFYSVAITFLGRKDTLFWELATFITIMLLGHWIEMRAVSGAQSAQRIVKTFCRIRRKLCGTAKWKLSLYRK